MRLRIFVVALTLTLPVLGPAAAASGAVCAASGGPHAALVVDTGRGATMYCVALDAASVSGSRLIQLAGTQYGLSYRLGFGGQAVCQLGGVGSAGGDCFASYPEYWGYWHGNGTGGWAWAGSGAGSASIGDGDTEGWSWGTGDSGSSHRPPPAVAFDDVCAAAPKPSPTPPPPPDGGGDSGSGNAGGSGSGEGDSGGGSVSGGNGTPASSPTPRPSQTDPLEGSPSANVPPLAGTLTPTIVEATPVSELAGTSGASGGGPGPGPFIVIGAIAALGGAGWLLRRRAAREEP